MTIHQFYRETRNAHNEELGAFRRLSQIDLETLRDVSARLEPWLIWMENQERAASGLASPAR